MSYFEVPGSNSEHEGTRIDSIDILANVGHEIRNSLNSIIGLSHLLNSATSLSEVDSYNKGLMQTSENLLEIGNNLLDFGKLRSGSLSVNLKPVDLQERLSFQLGGQRMTAQAKGLYFFVNYDDAIPENLLLDSCKVGQILINIVSNAIKFTEAGQVGVGVKLQEKTATDVRLLFTVEDTGIGIASDSLLNIFEPFDQGSKDIHQDFGGTGLGLTICKKLVEILGGSLMVESELGKGSKFSFALPAAIGVKEDKDELPRATSKVLKGLRLLLVEDSKLNQLIAQKYLQAMEVECTTVSNGLMAVELIEKQDFDVIITDLRMPLMDGYELVKNLRSRGDEKFRNVPIIALTGSVDGQNQEDFRKHGFSDYLLKPFQPQDLLKVILGQLEKSLEILD